jgi:hypothetical protein
MFIPPLGSFFFETLIPFEFDISIIFEIKKGPRRVLGIIL